MSKVLILVEGYAEEKFVNAVLKPHFEPKGIFVIPRNLKGVGKYTIIRDEVNRLLKDSSARLVTTMIDLYRIPSDFPQKNTLVKTHRGVQKVAILEDGFKRDIDKDKFFCLTYNCMSLKHCSLVMFQCSQNYKMLAIK